MPTNTNLPKTFAPWKPFWLWARAAAYFAASFTLGAAGWYLHEQWNGGPSQLVVALWSPFALVGFFGMAFCGFAAIISLWIGVLTHCPVCGRRFAGFYFATKCQYCGSQHTGP